ncbi:hypothetical protein B0H16DRAFT_691211 [Mycena metata]|uniref:Uncharacterized protein n=1 Tax=Mycena metata TaxID=1033252 RepID=A0AAD7GUS7_9AGAR|nr:hypothetical protein B0H16DRAFT_691211 [Mycena metata]
MQASRAFFYDRQRVVCRGKRRGGSWVTNGLYHPLLRTPPAPHPHPHLRPSCPRHSPCTPHSPAPPRTLLAHYRALITPSSAYLAAPTNRYAHAGLPKRFVHLVGPSVDVALDARGSGRRGRWVVGGGAD